MIISFYLLNIPEDSAKSKEDGEQGDEVASADVSAVKDFAGFIRLWLCACAYFAALSAAVIPTCMSSSSVLSEFKNSEKVILIF